MNVFILHHVVPYEGASFMGVFSSREAAHAAVPGADWGWDEYDKKGVTTRCDDPEWSNHSYVVTRVVVRD